MSVRTIQHTVRELGIRAGIQRMSVSPQLLRHTFAHAQGRANPKRLEDLAATLGHRCVDSTRVYISRAGEATAESLEQPVRLLRTAGAGDHLSGLVNEFLTELRTANRSDETCRAYLTDLGQFAVFHSGGIEAVTPEVLRAFGATWAHLMPASRARKQAALSSFLTWPTARARSRPTRC